MSLAGDAELDLEASGSPVLTLNMAGEAVLDLEASADAMLTVLNMAGESVMDLETATGVIENLVNLPASEVVLDLQVEPTGLDAVTNLPVSDAELDLQTVPGELLALVNFPASDAELDLQGIERTVTFLSGDAELDLSASGSMVSVIGLPGGDSELDLQASATAPVLAPAPVAPAPQSAPSDISPPAGSTSGSYDIPPTNVTAAPVVAGEQSLAHNVPAGTTVKSAWHTFTATADCWVKAHVINGVTGWRAKVWEKPPGAYTLADLDAYRSKWFRNQTEAMAVNNGGIDFLQWTARAGETFLLWLGDTDGTSKSLALRMEVRPYPQLPAVPGQPHQMVLKANEVPGASLALNPTAVVVLRDVAAEDEASKSTLSGSETLNRTDQEGSIGLASASLAAVLYPTVAHDIVLTSTSGRNYHPNRWFVRTFNPSTGATIAQTEITTSDVTRSVVHRISDTELLAHMYGGNTSTGIHKMLLITATGVRVTDLPRGDHPVHQMVDMTLIGRTVHWAFYTRTYRFHIDTQEYAASPDVRNGYVDSQGYGVNEILFGAEGFQDGLVQVGTGFDQQYGALDTIYLYTEQHGWREFPTPSLRQGVPEGFKSWQVMGVKDFDTLYVKPRQVGGWVNAPPRALRFTGTAFVPDAAPDRFVNFDADLKMTDRLAGSYWAWRSGWTKDPAPVFRQSGDTADQQGGFTILNAPYPGFLHVEDGNGAFGTLDFRYPNPHRHDWTDYSASHDLTVVDSYVHGGAFVMWLQMTGGWYYTKADGTNVEDWHEAFVIICGGSALFERLRSSDRRGPPRHWRRFSARFGATDRTGVGKTDPTDGKEQRGLRLGPSGVLPPSVIWPAPNPTSDRPYNGP